MKAARIAFYFFLLSKPKFYCLRKSKIFRFEVNLSLLDFFPQHLFQANSQSDILPHSVPGPCFPLSPWGVSLVPGMWGRTGRCAGPSPPLPHGPAAGQRLWQRHLPRLTLVHSHLSPPQPPRKYSPSPSTLCSPEPPGSQIPFARTARLAPLRGSGNFQMTACATPGWRETQGRGREGFLSHLTPFHCSCTSPPGP